MVIGLVICEVLEGEMSYLISHDPEVGKVTLVENDPGADLIADLRHRIGGRLSLIKRATDFSPDPTISLELLAVVLRVGLHMDKELLQKEVSEQTRLLDENSDVIIMGYGLCGNVLLNIEELLTDVHSPIIMPQNQDGSTVDDCVGLVLGGTEKYLEQLYKEAGTWFVTPGWLKHWETLLVKELHAPDIETVKWIFEKASYKRALMVDTGIGDKEKFRDETQKFADLFGFYMDEAEGTLDVLKKCFDGAKGLIKKKRKEVAKEKKQRMTVTERK